MSKVLKKKKRKKFIIGLVPYALAAYAGNRLCFAYRMADGADISQKLPNLTGEAIKAFTVNFFPSFNVIDLTIGLVGAGLLAYVMWDMKTSKRKLRGGEEHGSARWGNAQDFEPFMDYDNPDNNIILTQTEHLTLDAGKGTKDRNKCVLVIGATGSGKTFCFVLPQIMQMHTCFVITDPKGTVLEQCGAMLERGRAVKKSDGTVVYKPYKIKVFNTIDCEKSMHYNPFHYFRKEKLQKDIKKFINVLIANTGDKAPGGDEFWVKAEKLLYTAYIALIFTLFPEEERNINTLCMLITHSTASEDGEEKAPSKVDIIFNAMEKWLDGTFDPKKFSGFNFTDPATEFEAKIGRFALNYYKRFKAAAGKTMKSIIISCSARLSEFDVDEVAEMISKDDLELDTIGDRLTALFIIVSDTDKSLNFLVAIMYAQMFDMLCDKANKQRGHKLKHHVRFILDEFANIGQIPEFEVKISVLRSRNMSVSLIIQNLSQLETLYKDKADKTIISNCDSTLYLGNNDTEVHEWLSKKLGKTTIDTRNYSLNTGTNSGSYTKSDQKTGRELMTPDEIQAMSGERCLLLVRGIRPFYSLKYATVKHKNYRLLANDDNPFDVEKYVTTSMKKPKKTLVISTEDTIELYNF